MNSRPVRTFVLKDGGHTPGPVITSLLAQQWPAIEPWYTTRPPRTDGRDALAHHMPELLTQYDQLVAASHATPTQAALLTGWCPPPLPGACTSAASSSGSPTLIRTYDYPPSLVAMTMLRTHWTGTPILGQTDTIWGLVDGTNGHLAAAITFGGRTHHGTGFAIPLIVRYLLTTCTTTHDAITTLERLPSAGAYNITLTDTHGTTATCELAPDRPMRLTGRPWAANRQNDTTEMPYHAAASGTLERENALADLYTTGPVDAHALADLFSRWPIGRHMPGTDWGTVYTASYDLHARTATLTWPHQHWTIPLDGTSDETGPTDPHLATW